MKARIAAILLSVVSIFSVSCGASQKSESQTTSTPENGARKIVPQTTPLHISADVSDVLDLAHYEDAPDILLIDVDMAREFVFDMVLSSFATYEFEETDTTVKITRNNGAYCVLDFVNDSIYFNDFDLFRVRFNNSISDMLMTSYVDTQGNDIYFQRKGFLDVAGHPVHIDLAEKDIPLDIYEGKKYIPFQTLNDLFIAPYGTNFVFNSKDVFMLSSSGVFDPVLEEKYYSIEPTQRSEELANFTLNELSLLFDIHYGLQDEHGFDGDFKDYLERIGLLDEMLSPDPETATTALASLLYGYIADKHSEVKMISPYTGGEKIDKDSIKFNPSFSNYFEYLEIIQTERANSMPNGVPAYQEIGNTAYLTFDSFYVSAERFTDYNENSTQINDTISLIIYAHSQINREGSPIENVVLDLSCNGGGLIDAGIYAIAWMLGSCDLHVVNPITNNLSTTTYAIDVNLDGVFDENDYLSNKNLYCMLSPVSFSCGNLVPALLKESGRVTLLGNTSSGGACAVQMSCTADGSIFSLSSSFRISTAANGSYYNIDKGVTPHVYLSKLESFFDRDSLTSYINNLK